MNALLASLKRFNTIGLILATLILVADGYFWHMVTLEHPITSKHHYALDADHDGGELIVFDGGIRIMTDAGPTDAIVQNLTRVLGNDDRYIDIAIIPDPETDHFNGYNYLLDDGYRFGAFIYNGRDADPPTEPWAELLTKIKTKNIPLITLGAGDSIREGKDRIDILSPDKAFAQSPDIKDTRITISVL